jgi:hypothetical protein
MSTGENVTSRKRLIPPSGVLQEWVAKLGLRHQGVLLTGIRGCDIAPKDDPSKDLSRCIRAAILNTHCDDPKKSVSFIEQCEPEEISRRIKVFAKNHDHYPHHFVMHIVHTIEIIGYYHPDPVTQTIFNNGYVLLCDRMHMHQETRGQLDARLNENEENFNLDRRE